MGNHFCCKPEEGCRFFFSSSFLKEQKPPKCSRPPRSLSDSEGSYMCVCHSCWLRTSKAGNGGDGRCRLSGTLQGVLITRRLIAVEISWVLLINLWPDLLIGQCGVSRRQGATTARLTTPRGHAAGGRPDFPCHSSHLSLPPTFSLLLEAQERLPHSR